MQRQVILIGIGFLFLTLCFSGCDQLIMKPDHISVNIMVAVNIQFLDANNNIIQKNTDGLTVTIYILKNGQDRLVFERIMQNGLCQATGDFSLSKGNFIECTADIKDENNVYDQVFQGYAKLTWETVSASTNFGGVYNWYPKITLTLKE
ncbi:MAG: hypothetical protein NTX92_07475 [Euryarchaeota archaeon]|nr:hypothetical protein [Euryarchaeota archaeon]